MSLFGLAQDTEGSNDSSDDESKSKKEQEAALVSAASSHSKLFDRLVKFRLIVFTNHLLCSDDHIMVNVEDATLARRLMRCCAVSPERIQSIRFVIHMGCSTHR